MLIIYPCWLTEYVWLIQIFRELWNNTSQEIELNEKTKLIVECKSIEQTIQMQTTE